MTERTTGPRLLVVGNIPVDVVVAVPWIPGPGREVAATDALVSPGGAFNVCVAAARAGARVMSGAAHGTGPFGDLVRRGLDEAGVEVIQPPTRGRDSGWLVVIVRGDADEEGDRSFVTTNETEIPVDRHTTARLETDPGDAVYLSGYLIGHPASATAVLDWVERLPSDRLLCCDLGPAGAQAGSPVLSRLLARVDWVSCNRDEARAATGLSDLRDVAQALRDRSDHAGVVVRDGARGCLLAAPGTDDIAQVPTIEVRAVDTNGAGDAHCGWFLAALLQGMEPATAARRANVAAALAVTRHGPATSPTLDEVRGLLP